MSTGPGEPRGVQELRADIEHTRDELSATLNELSERADVPARARAAVGERAAQLKDRAPQPVQHALERTGRAVRPVLDRARPYRGKIAAALAGSAAVAWVVRRRRRS